MLPLFLNLEGCLAVVVGGGLVGRRKMSALLAGGMRVRLVSLEPPPLDCPQQVTWLTEPYECRHLEGATLVMAAAPAEVNARVTADARRLGLWVNSATEPAEGDFFLPSVSRRGQLVIAVGTGGKAPALARSVRQLLEGQLDEAFTQWAALLAELRPLVNQRLPDLAQRRRFWQRLCNPEWLELLRKQDPEQVRSAMLAAIKNPDL